MNYKPIKERLNNCITPKKYKANRKLLIKLWNQSNGKCCYCNCNTVLPISGYDGRQPVNIATIEHTYNRFSLIRLFFLGRFEYVKIACWKCNHTKGETDAADHYKDHNYRENHDRLLINLLSNGSCHPPPQ